MGVFRVVSSSTPRPSLLIANWSALRKMGFLTLCFHWFILYILPSRGVVNLVFIYHFIRSFIMYNLVYHSKFPFICCCSPCCCINVSTWCTYTCKKQACTFRCPLASYIPKPHYVNVNVTEIHCFRIFHNIHFHSAFFTH